MAKHRSTGEPEESDETPHVEAEQKVGDRLKILAHVAAKADERPPSDEVLIELLPPSRQGPGELIKVPAQNFGFALTVHDVLYVHVSDAEDGTYQYIPFSAK